MNLKLQKLIGLFNERRTLFNNHPDSYRFIRDAFKNNLEEGTQIQIVIKTPQGEESSTILEIQASDKKFMDNLSDMLKD